MRQPAIRTITALLLCWARLYTLGLPPESRHSRMDTLRSDAWEEAHDRLQQGQQPITAALALLARAISGVPDDLAWRLLEARRPPRTLSPAAAESRTAVSNLNPLPLLAVATGIAWAIVAVLAVQAVPHSLAYAAAFLAIISLGGWTLEARARAEAEAGPSVWPLLLAFAIALLAAGLLVEAGRAGLLLAVPVALGLGAAFLRTLRRCELNPDARSQPPAALPATRLDAAAREGAAIAIERRHAERGLSRRTLLRGTASLGLFSLVATMGGMMTDFLYRRNVAGFGSVVTAGHVDRFPPGTKARNIEGKFWLVNLTPDQGGPGFLALWQRCPHLGCVVPWEERFNFTDPQTNQSRQGWFRCGCHQSTYNDAGVRVYGPATRSMDRMALQITEDGIIEVNTGDITNGTVDNAAHAVRPE